MSLEFAAARLNMVENQVRTSDVPDLNIQDAMRVVPREQFCDPQKTYLAYAEAPVEYQPGWFLMQPRDVAKLLHALTPLPGERALAIAAPYAAAVLKKIGLLVTELTPSDDLKGLIAGGPYDVAICEAAVSQVPAGWLDALTLGGRLGAVERNGPVGKAKVFSRVADNRIADREVFDATPPVAPGFEAAPSFAF